MSTPLKLDRSEEGMFRYILYLNMPSLVDHQQKAKVLAWPVMDPLAWTSSGPWNLALPGIETPNLS